MDGLVYVIHERDLKDNEIIIIGVASTVLDADYMINEYYRDFVVISHRQVDDGGVEWVKLIKGVDQFGEFNYELTLLWFTIDSI